MDLELGVGEKEVGEYMCSSHRMEVWGLNVGVRVHPGTGRALVAGAAPWWVLNLRGLELGRSGVNGLESGMGRISLEGTHTHPTNGTC